MILVIDYGLGNLMSVAGAVARLGCPVAIGNTAADLAQADKLILPGVGAFADGMRNLQQLGLVDLLNHWVREQHKPILGICLGFQLFCRQSHEFGLHDGLGWLAATVRKLPAAGGSLRLPHVGWNDLFQVCPDPLFTDVPPTALFYYVHSFGVQCEQPAGVIGECEYGERFTAAYHAGNLYGTQFHPEKSQFHGLTVLRNFIERG